MIIKFFSVFDSAANRYLEPFTGPTAEFAIRGFREACSRPDHQFAKFPEDYHLFELAEMNQETGIVTALRAPHSLGSAIAMIDYGKVQEEANG